MRRSLKDFAPPQLRGRGPVRVATWQVPSSSGSAESVTRCPRPQSARVTARPHTSRPSSSSCSGRRSITSTNSSTYGAPLLRGPKRHSSSTTPSDSSFHRTGVIVAGSEFALTPASTSTSKRSRRCVSRRTAALRPSASGRSSTRRGLRSLGAGAPGAAPEHREVPRVDNEMKVAQCRGREFFEDVLRRLEGRGTVFADEVAVGVRG